MKLLEFKSNNKKTQPSCRVRPNIGVWFNRAATDLVFKGTPSNECVFVEVYEDAGDVVLKRVGEVSDAALRVFNYGINGGTLNCADLSRYLTRTGKAKAKVMADKEGVRLVAYNG